MVRTTDPSRAAARPGRLAGWVDGILEARPTRIVLSAAIVASLVPQPALGIPNAYFVALFAAELAARIYVFWDARRRGTSGTAPAWTLSLLLLDFLALLSFAPVPETWAEARWLRVFRLSRMLLLAGYWAPLAKDLWLVVSRRERWQQVLWMGVAVGLLSFAGATLLAHLGGGEVDFDEDGTASANDRRFFALLWWSFRQIQDPGNMLASPSSTVALFVSLVLTVFGLFLVSFLIGLGTDVVRELLELGRVRPPGLAGHTVIVNVDARAERLLRELFGFYRKSEGLRRALENPTSLRHLWDGLRGTVAPDFVVTGPTPEEPAFLKDRDFARVVYRSATEREQDFLERVDGHRARRLLLLADHERPDPDARTVETMFFLAGALDEAGHDGPAKRLLLAEVLDEAHLAAAEAALASTRTVRGIAVPTERLAGLFWSCLVREPGAGRLLTELLSSRGREIYTVIFDAEALSLRVPRPAWMPADPKEAFPAFEAHALGLSERSVAPFALLCGRRGDEAYGHLDVYFGGDDPVPDAPVRGMAVVADNVAGARALAVARPAGGSDPGDPPPLSFEPAVGAGALRRVVVLGFRRATAHMAADLLRACPTLDVLVLVPDERAARRARGHLSAHALACSLSRARHESGTFRVEGAAVRYVCSAGEGRIAVAVADVTDPTVLDGLPDGFGSICDADAVVFVAEPSGAADARTTAAVFEILALSALHGRTPPRLLVEVSEAELAHRLAADLGRRFWDAPGHVEVHAYDELRSLFLFQSVVVPGFDALYTTMLSSRGRRLRRLVPSPPPAGPVTFPDLVRAASARSLRLLAVEVGDGPHDPDARLFVAPRPDEEGYRVVPSKLAAVWAVVSPS